MASTFNVPEGSKTHGDPNLLCVPPSWSDLAVFFGANYLAHAATLIPRPGQSFSETLIDTLNALFIPGSGMIRAIRLLVYDTDLHRKSRSLTKAARAGALCMVRNKRHVLNAKMRRDTESGAHNVDWLSDHFNLVGDPVYVPLSRSFLGTCKIRDHANYCLVEVPRGVPLRALMPDDEPASSSPTHSSAGKSGSVLSTRRSKTPKIEVPGKLDFAKILISILQLVWGISTLYNSCGNQIDLYGYAAFGLTVPPYAVMSFLNLLASLALPIHNTMYLVWNDDMSEATHDVRLGCRAGKFAGMIAAVDLRKASEKVDLDGERISYNEDGPFERLVRLGVYYSFYLLVAVLPLAIVGAFTGFRTGTDLRVQRAWILAWLIIGSVSPILISNLSARFHLQQRTTSLQVLQRFLISEPNYLRAADKPSLLGWFVVLILLPLWIPAIGVMVVVGKMLQDFGVCTRLD